MGSRHIPALLLILCIGLLGACTAIPMASTHEDLQAKRFAVRPHKASIYVYRDQSFGFAFPMTLELAGHAKARTVGQTYVLWEVDPGAYELTSYAEDTSTLRLHTEPGKAYYVWQEVKVGLWKARTALHRVDEEQGRKGVLECRLGKLDS
jgi:hypothetical protein